MAPQSPENNDKQTSSGPNKPSSTSSSTKPRPARVINTNENHVAPACDQCRLRKIRCDRAKPNCSNCRKVGSVCDFSNRSSRVSHTKQIVNNFTTLASRLQSIDESFAKFTQHFLNAVPLAADAAPQSTVQEPEDLELFHPVLNNNTPRVPTSSTLYQDILRPMSHVVDTQGNERYHGCTAGLSLFGASRQQLKFLLEDNGQTPSKSSDAIDIDLLLASNPVLKSKLEIQYENFPFSPNSKLVDIDFDANANPSAHAGAVASPPKAFLDASLDCFLREINSINPIFNEAKLRESINLHYSLEEHERSEAKNLCFNNIIILATTAQLRKAQVSAAVNSMEKEFLKSFLSNASRALQNLDAFCSSSILNAQTLITLVLVAREHYAHRVAENLCHRVCHTIKLMGLQQSSVLDKTLLEGDSEREGVYWTLYIMDKQRTFMTGHPCNLYLFDSDLNLLITNNSSRISKLIFTQVHLMAIWEEIYICLYSQRAMRLGALQDQEKVTGKLFGLLRKWTSHYSEILSQSSEEDPSPASYLQIELKYCFHVAQVLILRHSSTPSNAQLCIANARAAVTVILDTYRAKPTIGSMSLLARIFRNYPVVAFLELYNVSFGVSAPQLAANLQLLSNCAEVLASLKDNPHSQRAYYSRLHLGLTWYTDNLSFLLDAAESGYPRSKESSHVPSESTTSVSSLDDALSHHQSSSDLFPRPSSQKEHSSAYDESFHFPASSLSSIWESHYDFEPLTFAGNPKFPTKNSAPFTSLNSGSSTDSTPNLKDHMDISGMPLQNHFSLEQYLPPELDVTSGNSSYDMFGVVNFPMQFGSECNDIDMSNWDLNPDQVLSF